MTDTPDERDAIAIAVPSGDHDSAEIPSTVVTLVRSSRCWIEQHELCVARASGRERELVRRG